MLRHDLLSTEDPITAAYDVVSRSMREAAAARGRVALSLAGGSTPLPLYRLLAEHDELPWERSQLFWGDERFVPPEHEESNRRSVQEALVAPLGLDEAQVHPWPILDSPEQSAAAYASTLSSVLGEPPVFDLTILGLGEDCHTASLFPGVPALQVSPYTAVSRPESSGAARLTLTADTLSRSRTVLFLVQGGAKRNALDGLLAARGEVEKCPARAVAALEKLLVITDLDLPVS